MILATTRLCLLGSQDRVLTFLVTYVVARSYAASITAYYRYTAHL